MKKIKVLTSLVGLTGLSIGLAPAITGCNCGNKREIVIDGADVTQTNDYNSNGDLEIKLSVKDTSKEVTSVEVSIDTKKLTTTEYSFADSIVTVKKATLNKYSGNVKITPTLSEKIKSFTVNCSKDSFNVGEILTKSLLTVTVTYAKSGAKVLDWGTNGYQIYVGSTEITDFGTNGYTFVQADKPSKTFVIKFGEQTKNLTLTVGESVGELVYTPIDATTCSVKFSGTLPTSMATLVLPEKATIGNAEYTLVTVEEEGFKNQTNLTSISFPKTLTKIGKNAFNGCAGLTSVTFANIMKKWDVSIAEAPTILYATVEDINVNATNLTTRFTGSDWVCSTQTSLYLPGSMNGWDVTKQMTTVSNWIFSYTFTADSTEYEFKVLYLADWGGGSTPYSGMYLDNSFKVEGDSYFTFIGWDNAKISGLTSGTQYTININMETQKIWVTVG